MFPAKKHIEYMVAHGYDHKQDEHIALTGGVFRCYNPCTESPEEYMQKLDKSLEEARSQQQDKD